jgi:hypothetical protein
VSPPPSVAAGPAEKQGMKVAEPKSIAGEFEQCCIVNTDFH